VNETFLGSWPGTVGAVAGCEPRHLPEFPIGRNSALASSALLRYKRIAFTALRFGFCGVVDNANPPRFQRFPRVRECVNYEGA
jgi:hypothetical protein